MYKNPFYIYGPRDVDVPMNLNFGEFLIDRLWKNRGKVAFVNAMTKEIITYDEILRQSMSIAISFTRMGLKRRDVVGIISENRDEYCPSIIGTACTGAAVSTFSTSYEAGELKHTLNISKPKYIFVSPTIFKKHEKTLRSLAFIRKIIVYGSEAFNNTISYNDLMNINIKYEDFVCADVYGQTDTLFIIYSSGTTGLAKGVMLTHLNVIVCCCIPSSIDPTEKVLAISPWYHSMGLISVMVGLSDGRTGVYMPRFDIDVFLKTIEHYKISQLYVVPPVLVAICKYPKKYDLSSVRMIYSGAAPLYKETVIEVHQTFPNLEAVLQGYGASETTLAVTRFPMDEIKLAPKKMGSIGVVSYGLIVKVVDVETRKPLGPNQEGEICVKGSIVMKGYVGKGKGDDFDHEGFYKTGDVGYYDEDGFFYIADRLKELIKYKGYQVPPAELEGVLLTHPAVKDVGVIGVPDKMAGEVPMAFIVLLPGKEAKEDDFKKFIAERLSNPKHLRGGVKFINEIPKSVSGKILRRELRKMAKHSKSKL